MYKLFTVILAITILLACSRKSLPVITSRPAETKPAEKAISNVQPDTAAGKIIFMNRCSRCHDLPQPSQYTAARWEGILSYMIPRARVDAEQSVHLTAYLKSHAGR